MRFGKAKIRFRRKVHHASAVQFLLGGGAYIVDDFGVMVRTPLDSYAFVFQSDGLVPLMPSDFRMRKSKVQPA